MKQIIDKSIDKTLDGNEDQNEKTVIENNFEDSYEDIQQKVEFEDQILDNRSEQLSKIQYCLQRNDIKGLKRLATMGSGFITDRLRQKIWPKLTNVSVIETSPRPDTDTIEGHPFYNQVILDVNRSLKRFPPCIGETQRISMQDSLIRLIMRVLIKNPDLHYFQGYHDICVTFLMILGEEMAFYCVNKLSKTHFKAYMEKTMEKTSDLMDIIPIIVRHENQTLSDHLERSEVGTIYALSWVITWFSHVLPTYEDVSRLFDFFIASHSLMPLYLTAALVLYKQNHILSLDCDMASIHHYLTKVPETEELPIESLIESALDLIDRYPPNELIKEQELYKKNCTKRRFAKNGFLQNVFDYKYLFRTFFRINFMSVTVLVVFCATIYQFYWNV